ncbi:IS1 family transposase [Klebsiella pneumoniae]|uniref:IS1 family transposase n=1 Tax=Klebsiella pneumoniae TaxID=573 RepID=UPI00237AE293|nr:IS1 family transposase [Klebsiella pneumoniae]
MTDGWPLYESRLKGKAARNQQSDIRSELSGITRNLEAAPARLGRKSLSFSKSVELRMTKVIGHYLNIKHYQ